MHTVARETGERGVISPYPIVVVVAKQRKSAVEYSMSPCESSPVYAVSNVEMKSAAMSVVETSVSASAAKRLLSIVERSARHED